ncbi:MAG: PDDEXK nuclease domain-containing protein [Candidatus Woesearchaeota archaeon]|nr:PDDEXK nuclease domain-containing protein [Candidatus Woesearchaeota archaeon]
MKLPLSEPNYGNFLIQVKERIRKAQYEALKAVNKELIDLYWDIGRMIVEKQKEFGWGKSIVENLAKDLQKEYSGIKGFSAPNLWRMRNFYQQYASNQKLAPLVREISWVKNVIIMEKCKDDSEREFYIRMTKKFGWTKDVLINHIENRSYEKYLLNQTNFDKALPEKYKMQAKLAVKDDYTFDFLELSEEHSEKELEKSLTERIKHFLTEMGSYFCFVGSQYRIEIGDEEFFIDLLLYHRKLKCLVALELKIGDFKPEYAGKMQFYLSVLDDKAKLDGENPSIGIIICKSKVRTIVEYALKDVRKPMGVSTYKIIKELPKNLSKYLPSKEELSKRLERIA